MKKYQPGLGLILSTFITLSILPIRLSEGQSYDLANLIGSEIVIWFMLMTCWLGANFIQQNSSLPGWQRVLLAVLLCVVLSNLFYRASNPFFEDYPLAPIHKNTFWVGILRLSIRGLLVSVMMVPFIFYLDRERKRQNERIEMEKRYAKDLEQRNSLLEQTVRERTKELEMMLSDVTSSQKELDNQIYIQSRLLASITHDIQGPFRYVLIVSETINRLASEGKFEQLPEYTQALEGSLERMFLLLKNLLEFTKAQIQNQVIHSGLVDLHDLILDKSALFEGIVKLKNSELHIEIDKRIQIHTNPNLFAIILHNLLDNAAKYTDDGNIRVYIENDPNPVLVIENTGHGIPAHVVDWLTREQFDDGPDSIATSQTIGIGLILVKQIAALLNIRFFIKASANKTMACLDLQTVDFSVAGIA